LIKKQGGDRVTQLITRPATLDDLPALRALMERAIAQLQTGFLTQDQIAASRSVMGLDTQLVRDGTYLVVEEDGLLAGCGGWSRRATLYGGDHSAALRDARLLDPAREPARIRAMYTHPDFARRGVGRRILAACDGLASAERFTRMELMSTLSGAPLYTACGYVAVERIENDVDCVKVPLIRMTKDLAGS